MDNTGLANAVQQLACVGVAAPTPDWAAYMADRGIDSDAVRRRNGRLRVLEHRAERHAVRQDVRVAALVAVESAVERTGAQQPVHRRRSTATYSLNLNQASTFDLNFNPTAAVRAGRRRQPPGVRAAVEHRPAHRRDRGRRSARHERVLSRERAAVRHEVGGAAGHAQPVADDLQLDVRLGPVVRLREHARAVSRLHEHGGQSARRRVGPLAASTRAIRSSIG